MLSPFSGGRVWAKKEKNMCTNPSYIWVLAGPNYVKVTTKCRGCKQCGWQRVNDFTGRALAEAAYSEWTVTLTLTYRPSNDAAISMLNKTHAQNFVRALRDQHYKIRYLVVGENGKTKSERSHFHIILFGNGEKPTTCLDPKTGRGHVGRQIPQQENCHIPQWPHGHVFADWTADAKAISYCMKYMIHDKDKSRYWFSCSKKPALGAAFFNELAQEHIDYGLFPQTFTYLPPGANPDFKFTMQGSSRRDFIHALMVGMALKSKDTLNEWVHIALHKVHKWQFLKLCAKIEAEGLEKPYSERFVEYGEDAGDPYDKIRTEVFVKKHLPYNIETGEEWGADAITDLFRKGALHGETKEIRYRRHAERIRLQHLHDIEFYPEEKPEPTLGGGKTVSQYSTRLKRFPSTGEVYGNLTTDSQTKEAIANRNAYAARQKARRAETGNAEAEPQPKKVNANWIDGQQ